MDRGNLDEARAMQEEGLALQREVGDQYYIASAMHTMANIIRDQGDYPAAFRLYRESLEIYRQLSERWMLAYLLEDLACLAAKEKQPQRAFKLVGAASALREAVGAPLSLAESIKLDSVLTPAHQVLSEEEQIRWMSQGKAAPLDEILDEALRRE